MPLAFRGARGGGWASDLCQRTRRAHISRVHAHCARIGVQFVGGSSPHEAAFRGAFALCRPQVHLDVCQMSLCDCVCARVALPGRPGVYFISTL
eukprot:5200504-Prymnesium_polylepis.1